MPGMVPPVVADCNGSDMDNGMVDRKGSSVKTGWSTMVCLFE